MRLFKKNLCKDFETEIWLYIDGSLNEKEKINWQNHIRECSKCSARLTGTNEIIDLYKSAIPAIDINDALYHKLIAVSSAENRLAKMDFYKPQVIFSSANIKKVAFAGLFIIASLLTFLLSKPPEPPSNVSLDWDDKENVNEINTLSHSIHSLQNEASSTNLVYEFGKENWDKAVEIIDANINKIDSEIEN